MLYIALAEEEKVALEHKKSGLSAIRFSIRSP